MEMLFEKIKDVEITIGPNFSYDLDEEFKLISSKLNDKKQKLLKQDFNMFFKEGKSIVFNSFSGGILFLKVFEYIEKIKIESDSVLEIFEASVEFKFEQREKENVKYKPGAGKIESIKWNVSKIFPNFFKYEVLIQGALLLVLGRIVKHICEYGRLNFVYMKIENEFPIELLVDGKLVSELEVKTSKTTV